MKAKEKIIEVAEEIFSDYHYEHATVKMICDRADVNMASVNYHFRSKKGLYLEVMASIHSRIAHKASRIFDLKIEEKSQEKWEFYITEIVSTIASISDDADIRKWHKILFREIHNPSEVFDNICDLYFLPFFEHINQNIKFILPDMSDQERFMWFLTLVAQASFIHSSRSLITKYRGSDFYEQDNIDKYVEHIRKTICDLVRVS